MKALTSWLAIAVCGTAACTSSAGGDSNHPAATSTAGSPARQITALSQSLLPDPPYGPGFQTTGSYPQVSGVPGLDAVNAALRALITTDQQRARDLFKDFPTPVPGVGPGTYSSDPSLGRSSASSAVVSYLIATTAVYPGGNDGDGWVSATMLVPSAREVSLTGLFADPATGLTTIASLVKDDLIATDSCVGQYLVQGIGSDGLAPTEANFHWFAITPAGLSIGLGQGQVGAEACGRKLITIGWDKVRPLLGAEGNQLVGELR